MKTFKTSKLRVYNNNGHDYIYIYYKEDNHTLKINTKYEYAKNKMTVDNLYNSKMDNHEKLNAHIQEMQWVVDSYINVVSGHHPVNQQECMRYVKENKYHGSKVPVETVSKITALTEYYDKFLESKKTNPFLKTISLKNYQSCKNFLADFQKYKGRKYFLFDVDKELIKQMISFSQVDLREKKGYVSKGHLQQNTLKKRLDVFKEFLIWLGDENIVTFNTHKLFPKIEKTTKEVVYVTAEEVGKLISTRDKIEGDYNKLSFDSFIFNCECGLRWNDLSNLSKSDFKKIPEGYVLTKELHKGNERFESESLIPIVTPLLVEIIEKYNFHFELKRNAFYNRTLRNLFKKHELFTEPITVKKKYIKGGVDAKDVLKNDVITCHSCRRSMITNTLMEGYNTVQVMQMSGHKNLKTLQKYTNFANNEILEKNLNQKLNKLKSNDSDNSSPSPSN
jgi:integrase